MTLKTKEQELDTLHAHVMAMGFDKPTTQRKHPSERSVNSRGLEVGDYLLTAHRVEWENGRLNGTSHVLEIRKGGETIFHAQKIADGNNGEPRVWRISRGNLLPEITDLVP